MKSYTGEPLNIDSVCGAGRALLIAGFAGGLVGILTGACIGLPFFGIGAIYGAVAGLPVGVVAALFGAAIGGRWGWAVSGAVSGLLGGLAIAFSMSGGNSQSDCYTLVNQLTWIAVFGVPPMLSGWFVGRAVGGRLCDEELPEKGLLSWVGRSLYNSGIYQMPVVLRLLLALFELTVICLTINAMFHR